MWLTLYYKSIAMSILASNLCALYLAQCLFGSSTGGSEVKASASNAGHPGSIPGLDPCVRKIPWRRKWQPTPVFLPRESHGRRSLVGYNPRDRKELDTTERLHLFGLEY